MLQSYIFSSKLLFKSSYVCFHIAWTWFSEWWSTAHLVNSGKCSEKFENVYMEEGQFSWLYILIFFLHSRNEFKFNILKFTQLNKNDILYGNLYTFPDGNRNKVERETGCRSIFPLEYLLFLQTHPLQKQLLNLLVPELTALGTDMFVES